MKQRSDTLGLICLSFTTAGIDYREASSDVRFAPLEQLSCVNISIIDNHIVGEQGMKTFTIEVSSDVPRVLATEYPTTAQVTVLENDGVYTYM